MILILKAQTHLSDLQIRSNESSARYSYDADAIKPMEQQRRTLLGRAHQLMWCE
jgi:hypothetical protein